MALNYTQETADQALRRVVAQIASTGIELSHEEIHAIGKTLGHKDFVTREALSHVELVSICEEQQERILYLEQRIQDQREEIQRLRRL